MNRLISKITLRNVKKHFIVRGKTHTLLRNVSLDLHKEKMYAITGPSGSGKSTLLALLADLQPCSSGLITYGLSDFQKIKRQLFGVMFQSPYLIRELTIQDNVRVKGLIAGFSSKESLARAEKFLDMVGLADKYDLYPAELSGGEQQRVALARALVHKPEFLLADEPTADLDKNTAQVIIQVLKWCQQEWGMGIIVNTHDDAVIAQADVVFALKDKTVVDVTENTRKQNADKTISYEKNA